MRWVATLIRFHRGGLPARNDPAFVGLDRKRRADLLRLMGVLRLANAFDETHHGKTRDLTVLQHNDAIVVSGYGVPAISREAERIARARYLLETVCRKAISIRLLRAPVRARVKAARNSSRAAQVS